MGFEDDPYRDEDGEALMDYDDFGHGESPVAEEAGGLLDDDLDEDLRWGSNSRSPTPVHDSGNKVKSRKRLVKKGQKGESSGGDFVPEDLEDEGVGYEEEEGDVDGFVEERRKMKGKDDGRMKKMKRKLEKYSEGKAGKSRSEKGGYSGKERDGDGDVNEMWNTIAGGGDSEDDHDGDRTMDDDNFIDDTGVDPADRYENDYGQHSPSHAPQAEEGEEHDEINDLFKAGKKRKKNEKSPAEIALLVENVMAELEVTAEEDAELNRQGKPAINKLKKLPLLTNVLSKKQLQLEFLDHGVLTLLKNWLEPLPDGSLPNSVIREAILKILTDFPIDLEQYDRKEQLKKSGLGKVIMFLSRSDEETTSNRKLAKELVDKWSRPIFNKSTRFEDMRNVEDERIPYRRPMSKKPVRNSRMDSGDGEEVDEFSRERKSGPSSSRLHASRPEATPMDFVVRPQSKIDPDEIRARAKQAVQDQRRMKMNKKLQQLKAPKKKRLQATKLSVEGRGMLKYL